MESSISVSEDPVLLSVEAVMSFDDSQLLLWSEIRVSAGLMMDDLRIFCMVLDRSEVLTLWVGFRPTKKGPVMGPIRFW